MGWIGFAWLGAAIGWFGWRLHPSRRSGLTSALVIGVLTALATKLAGNATGLFDDGDTLEWAAVVFVTLAAVATTTQLGAAGTRRRAR
jgi:hypothetical protein